MSSQKKGFIAAGVLVTVAAIILVIFLGVKSDDGKAEVTDITKNEDSLIQNKYTVENSESKGKETKDKETGDNPASIDKETGGNSGLKEKSQNSQFSSQKIKNSAPVEKKDESLKDENPDPLTKNESLPILPLQLVRRLHCPTSGDKTTFYPNRQAPAIDPTHHVSIYRTPTGDQKEELKVVIDYLKKAKNILIITGAGISVASGIPDFRSEGGFYEKMEKKYKSSPETLFSIGYFRNNPVPFYAERSECFFGEYHPTDAHRFIKLLEDKGKLALNVAQNIDTLEIKAGIKRFINAHGNMANYWCLKCNQTQSKEQVKERMKDKIGQVVKCDKCEGGIMRPSIVMYGESLAAEFNPTVDSMIPFVDLVIVMGTSMLVSPVKSLHERFPSVPRILINLKPIEDVHFDATLIGDCQDFAREFMKELSN